MTVFNAIFRSFGMTYSSGPPSVIINNGNNSYGPNSTPTIQNLVCINISERHGNVEVRFLSRQTAANDRQAEAMFGWRHELTWLK